MEVTLAKRELHIERKYLIIELRENERGRFLKISETAAGRRNIVIVPNTGFTEFAQALVSVLAANATKLGRGGMAGNQDGAEPGNNRATGPSARTEAGGDGKSDGTDE